MNRCSPLHSALPVIIGLLEEYQSEGLIPLPGGHILPCYLGYSSLGRVLP